jgi:hypothetical protein
MCSLTPTPAAVVHERDAVAGLIDDVVHVCAGYRSSNTLDNLVIGIEKGNTIGFRTGNTVAQLCVWR